MLTLPIASRRPNSDPNETLPVVQSKERNQDISFMEGLWVSENKLFDNNTNNNHTNHYRNIPIVIHRSSVHAPLEERREDYLITPLKKRPNTDERPIRPAQSSPRVPSLVRSMHRLSHTIAYESSSTGRLHRIITGGQHPSLHNFNRSPTRRALKPPADVPKRIETPGDAAKKSMTSSVPIFYASPVELLDGNPNPQISNDRQQVMTQQKEEEEQFYRAIFSLCGRSRVEEIRALMYLAILCPTIRPRDELEMPDIDREREHPTLVRLLMMIFIVVLLGGVSVGVGVLFGTIESGPLPAIASLIRPEDIWIERAFEIWDYIQLTNSSQRELQRELQSQFPDQETLSPHNQLSFLRPSYGMHVAFGKFQFQLYIQIPLAIPTEFEFCTEIEDCVIYVISLGQRVPLGTSRPIDFVPIDSVLLPEDLKLVPIGHFVGGNQQIYRRGLQPILFNATLSVVSSDSLIFLQQLCIDNYIALVLFLRHPQVHTFTGVVAFSSVMLPPLLYPCSVHSASIGSPNIYKS